MKTKAEILERFARHGLSAAECAVLTQTAYTPRPIAEVARHSACSDYCFGIPVTQSQCEAALKSCLKKGWLFVVTEAWLNETNSALRTAGVIGPIGGLPQASEIDVTESGIEVLVRLRDEERGLRKFDDATLAYLEQFPFIAHDAIQIRTACFFKTIEAATRRAVELREGDGVFSLTTPTKIGPWCVEWWRHYPEGYCFEYEERLQHVGRSGGSEYAWLPHASAADVPEFRRILEEHNVTTAEWFTMRSLDSPAWKTRYCLPKSAAKWAARDGRADVTHRECAEALQSCLTKKWLREMDWSSCERIQEQLRADGTIAPLHLSFGEIDFTAAGATFYLMLSEVLFGVDWDAGMVVEKQLYRKEHGYSLKRPNPESVLSGYRTMEHAFVRVSDPIPIGPWATDWRNISSDGFLTEIEIGDPSPLSERRFPPTIAQSLSG